MSKGMGKKVREGLPIVVVLASAWLVACSGSVGDNSSAQPEAGPPVAAIRSEVIATPISAQVPVTLRLQEVRRLWRDAAEGVAVEETLQTLAGLAADHDATVSQTAGAAIADLQNLRAREENPWSFVSTPDTAQQQIEDLALQLRNETNAGNRIALVQMLGNFCNDSAVVMLLDAATDGEAGVRRAVLENLWRAAADGQGDRDRINTVLLVACGDGDDEIAHLARQALADLQSGN